MEIRFVESIDERDSMKILFIETEIRRSNGSVEVFDWNCMHWKQVKCILVWNTDSYSLSVTRKLHQTPYDTSPHNST